MSPNPHADLAERLITFRDRLTERTARDLIAEACNALTANARFEIGKPAPYFCPVCQAVPQRGYCKLAGCPTNPDASGANAVSAAGVKLAPMSTSRRQRGCAELHHAFPGDCPYCGAAATTHPQEAGALDHGSSRADLSCAQTHTLTPSSAGWSDLDALEKVARAATPGPWGYDRADHPSAPYEVAAHDGSDWELFVAECRTGHLNARHIAAFDPPTVLRLLAERKALVEAAEGIDHLLLVIESAVRNDDRSHHEAVLAALKANRAALALTGGQS